MLSPLMPFDAPISAEIWSASSKRQFHTLDLRVARERRDISRASGAPRARAVSAARIFGKAELKGGSCPRARPS